MNGPCNNSLRSLKLRLYKSFQEGMNFNRKYDSIASEESERNEKQRGRLEKKCKYVTSGNTIFLTCSVWVKIA